MKPVGRREFVKSATLGGAGFLFLRHARSVESYQANERLNIAIVGAGGHGWANLNAVAGENIVALCDVDEEYAARAFQRFPDAPKFADFREMLDKMHHQIDAVVVTTPDHTHAVISVAAMTLGCLLYTSDAADEEDREDVGGQRNTTNKKTHTAVDLATHHDNHPYLAGRTRHRHYQP